MFGRSILTFVFLLICLVLATLWVVETESGARILPNAHHLVSGTTLDRWYNNTRYKVMDWWYATQGNVSGFSHKPEKITVDKQKIVKWQDEKGTWHFEYQKPTSVPDP